MNKVAGENTEPIAPVSPVRPAMSFLDSIRMRAADKNDNATDITPRKINPLFGNDNKMSLMDAIRARKSDD